MTMAMGDGGDGDYILKSALLGLSFHCHRVYD
jgi:hypothetical protein